jgi:tetratricopeptide (TPR) repeat protein
MRILLALSVMLLAWAGFAGTGLLLRDHQRPEDRAEVLRVRMPIPVQLAYSAGDPYLAANLNVFRSLMVEARVTEAETYRIQGQLQADAAFFNPRHEDNYYVGAAILPWNGQVAAAQDVLLRAAQSRDWDMWPAFYYAFNAMYFERDMSRAGHWAEVAAERHPSNAAALRDMAAKWYSLGDDPEVAMNILVSMFEQSKDENFRALLAARIVRLDGLQKLRAAASAYRERNQRAPSSLDDLIGYANLEAVPEDPLQLGYVLSSEGQPQLADTVIKQE